MVIDISKYGLRRNFIQQWYLDKGTKDPVGAIATLSASTLVPAIVVAYYVGEVSNWNPEVVETIKRLKDFYDYSDVINKPEGSPV
jgi:hypothetical protein